jgi:hypothetical protein
MSTARPTPTTSPTGQPENQADLDRLIPLMDLLKQFPAASRGEPTGTVSARRWIMDGIAARDGSRIHLWAVKAPRCWLSSRAAMIAFLDAQTADRLAARKAPATA